MKLGDAAPESCPTAPAQLGSRLAAFSFFNDTSTRKSEFGPRLSLDAEGQTHFRYSPVCLLNIQRTCLQAWANVPNYCLKIARDKRWDEKFRRNGAILEYHGWVGVQGWKRLKGGARAARLLDGLWAYEVTGDDSPQEWTARAGCKREMNANILLYNRIICTTSTAFSRGGK